MSLFRRASTSTELVGIGTRARARGRAVRSTEARQQSVVWAACRLRADLVSLMPVDVYRKAGPINVKVPTPPILTVPSAWADGQPMTISEWLGSSQMDLDTHGNAFGIVRAVDALGKPAQIDLVAAEDVSARIKDGRIVSYRIAGEKTETRHVWHERQYTVGGFPLGLSPIAHAALSILGASGAQTFATDWFANGAVPSAHLKNTAMEIPNAAKATAIKEQFQASVANGEVFVSGKDWEYSALAAKASESGFIQQMEYTDVALTRFFGVPADMVDVQSSTGSVTYANITQRNLQLLVMNLGGAVKRREDAISTRILPAPRFAKLNRDAVLAMDAKSRAELFKVQIDARLRAPSELRVLEDLEPFDEAQYSEFDRLFGSRTTTTPQTAPTGEK
ncbi:phage portal protein [Sanguibacter sp. HDW7]|uniref:phage portal protein n=1 Tax=Sanguibacter sp. HDW7 TaxID=2714931 RepID=UPI001407BA77|nr:phage portal protein [Sanguibacter sp. HDW7]QIK83103.1 phage portal protein [Sanguibacter sp. HDW7]